MEVDINWEFPNVELVKSCGRENVVRAVQYRIIGRLGARVAVREGSYILDDPSENFILFQDITNQMMVEWVSNRFSESVNAHLQSINIELYSQEAMNIKPHFYSTPAQ